LADGNFNEPIKHGAQKRSIVPVVGVTNSQNVI
jgi:hypothetical protein